MTENFFSRRLVRPLLELLRQGVTPEKLALSLALGVVLGVFPALGWTTVLCALAALILRLNIPATQLVNYFMYPVQLATIIPFFRLGEILFRAEHLPLSVKQIYAMARADLWGAIKFLWTSNWHAMVVWGLLAPPIAAAVYFALIPFFKRIVRRQKTAVRTAQLGAA
jgi:uncharacterized protein (DUF2062 family)